MAAELVPREPKGFASFDDDLRLELQPLARERGLSAPQLPRELGGGGFSFWESAVLFEEAGTSLLGPLALGIAAPDEGNCHLLARVADEAQRASYLLPLEAGEVRSCFAMSEPAPGVGSDPGLSARRRTGSRTGGASTERSTSSPEPTGPRSRS